MKNKLLCCFLLSSILLYDENNYLESLPWLIDRIHRGREILTRTSKAATVNRVVESTTSRSSVTICYLNILLEEQNVIKSFFSTHPTMWNGMIIELSFHWSLE